MKLRPIKTKKGNGMVTGVVVAIIFIVVASMLGVFLTSQFANQTPRTGFTAAQNTSFSNIQSNGLSGLETTSILIYVLIAVAALGLLGALGYSRMG